MVGTESGGANSMPSAGKLVAVGNLKGGVGKTTLAVSIACALADHGKAAVVDADAQASASAWSASGKLPVEVVALPLGADGERATAAWLERLVEIKSDVDVVLLDLPPNLGAATVAALSLADLLLVPVPPSGMDLRAAERTLALLQQARKVRRGAKPAALLVPSRVDRRTAAGREVEAVLHDMGEPVAPAVIQRAAHVDAFSAGEWIGAYAPRSAGHVEIQALAALVRRIVSK
jgi:chromosome partitioning protein